MTGPRILLVEDDDLNQALVRAILGRSADPVLRGGAGGGGGEPGAGAGGPGSRGWPGR